MFFGRLYPGLKRYKIVNPWRSLPIVFWILNRHARGWCLAVLHSTEAEVIVITSNEDRENHVNWLLLDDAKLCYYTAKITTVDRDPKVQHDFVEQCHSFASDDCYRLSFLPLLAYKLLFFHDELLPPLL